MGKIKYKYQTSFKMFLGPDLPMTLAGHSMVSLSKSAVVIGGYNGTSVQSKLYQIRLFESN